MNRKGLAKLGYRSVMEVLSVLVENPDKYYTLSEMKRQISMKSLHPVRRAYNTLRALDLINTVKGKNVYLFSLSSPELEETIKKLKRIIGGKDG